MHHHPHWQTSASFHGPENSDSKSKCGRNSKQETNDGVNGPDFWKNSESTILRQPLLSTKPPATTRHLFCYRISLPKLCRVLLQSWGKGKALLDLRMRSQKWAWIWLPAGTRNSAVATAKGISTKFLHLKIYKGAGFPLVSYQSKCKTVTFNIWLQPRQCF